MCFWNKKTGRKNAVSRCGCEMVGKSEEFTFVCEEARCSPQIGQGRGLFWGEYIVLRNLVNLWDQQSKIFCDVNVAMFLQVRWKSVATFMEGRVLPRKHQKDMHGNLISLRNKQINWQRVWWSEPQRVWLDWRTSIEGILKQPSRGKSWSDSRRLELAKLWTSGEFYYVISWWGLGGGLRWSKEKNYRSWGSDRCTGRTICMNRGLAQDLVGLELKWWTGTKGQEFLQKGRVTRAVCDLHESFISKKLQQSILHTLFALASTFVEVIGKCVTEPVLGLLTCAQQSQSTDTRLRCGAGGGGDEYRVYCRCKVRTGSTSSKDPDSPVFKDSVREGAAGYVVSSCTIFTRAGIKEIFQASSTFWFQPV